MADNMKKKSRFEEPVYGTPVDIKKIKFVNTSLPERKKPKMNDTSFESNRQDKEKRNELQ